MLTAKQEKFTLDVFQGLSAHEAYAKNYDTHALPNTIDRMAFDLIHNPKVSARLAELNKGREDKAKSTVDERMKILTQIQRATIADFVDEYGNLNIKNKAQLQTSAVQEIKTERTLAGLRTTLKLRDPVGAIAEHNKMEHIYTDLPPTQDNRQYNFYIQGNEAKEKLERLLAGEKPLMITQGSP